MCITLPGGKREVVVAGLRMDSTLPNLAAGTRVPLDRLGWRVEVRFPLAEQEFGPDPSTEGE